MILWILLGIEVLLGVVSYIGCCAAAFGEKNGARRSALIHQAALSIAVLVFIAMLTIIIVQP